MIVTANAFIFSEDKVLLIHHRKANVWMHPGGHVQENEEFSKAVIREVKEETNLDIELVSNKGFVLRDIESFKNDVIPFCMRVQEKKNGKFLRLDYLGTVKNPDDIKIQEEEILDYAWLSEEEVEKFDFELPLFKELVLEAFKEYKKLK